MDADGTLFVFIPLIIEHISEFAKDENILFSYQ